MGICESINNCMELHPNYIITTICARLCDDYVSMRDSVGFKLRIMKMNQKSFIS